MPLDLRGVRPGPAVFRLIADALDLPRGVTVARLTPSEVTLEFARVVRKSVPVRVAPSDDVAWGVLFYLSFEHPLASGGSVAHQGVMR